VLFGISLLGAFEITLPSSWSTKLDTKANSNSFGGIFFMALVLVVVSFSCTSAFISWLIVQIVQSQNRIGGFIGFLGFGIAISLPFALFAFFPGLLNNIAKSGGWLNSVKVTMGFVELAMAMKFLSNIDLQYHWHLLDYEVYLSLWIVIFGLLGLYLLGKLKFAHDDELPKNMFGHPYLSVTRLFFAIASLAFTVYMIPGLWGAPLSGISGWLPERKTLEFNLHDNIISLKSGQVSVEGKGSDVRPVKYTDNLKSELPGVTAFFDYNEALAASKKTGKPVLLDFTGHSCVNCRKMERAVLSKPEVLRQLSEDFIVASLYCDDKTELPEKEQYKSADGGMVTDLGERNIDLEVGKYGEVGQPIYIFVDSDGKILKKAGGYVPDVDRFLKIMAEVKENYKKK
jgi:thiol:disulfide interchange protein